MNTEARGGRRGHDAALIPGAHATRRQRHATAATGSRGAQRGKRPRGAAAAASRRERETWVSARRRQPATGQRGQYGDDGQPDTRVVHAI
jgi:hypothetical protein